MVATQKATQELASLPTVEACRGRKWCYIEPAQVETAGEGTDEGSFSQPLCGGWVHLRTQLQALLQISQYVSSLFCFCFASVKSGSYNRNHESIATFDGEIQYLVGLHGANFLGHHLGQSKVSVLLVMLQETFLAPRVLRIHAGRKVEGSECVVVLPCLLLCSLLCVVLLFLCF